MLTNPPAVFRKRHRQPKQKAKAAAKALTLTAAVYDSDELLLVLTFDRAVDVSGIVGAAILVDDQQHNDATFAATGAVELVSEAVVQIGLELVGDSTGVGVFLNAAAGNGIVAVDDGGAWAGATDLVLPFP